MKCVQMTDRDGIDALRLAEQPAPTPGAGEVLVTVLAAGVNPVDWKIAEGFGAEMFGHTLPITLGCEFAGVVAAVGENVTAWRPMDAVFGYCALQRCGAFAEQVVVLETELAAKPRSVEFASAAAFPVAALTSYQALFDGGALQSGQKVLIHAASGGVGSIGAQLAKAHGAHVIATASARNEEFVRGLGVDELIDYTATRFDDVVKNIDLVFDTIGGDTQARSLGVLKKGGRLVSIVSPPDEAACTARGVTGSFTGVRPDGKQLAALGKLLDAGKVRTEVAQVFPLEQFKEALHQSRSGRTRGKLVLAPQPPAA